MNMTPERKSSNSRKMKLRWMKAARYAEILGRPKEEVWNNLALCMRNSKGLRSGRPDVIAMVLKEGKWKETFNEEAYNRKLQERIDKENAEAKYEKEKAINIGYKPKTMNVNAQNVEVKTNGKISHDPFEGLKIAMWYINKVGSLEKAEKLFQAAKLAIEVAKES